jgi:glutaredoxin 3
VAAEVVMYRTKYCGYCVLAQRLLDQKGIRYRAVDVSGDSNARAWLMKVTGQRTVPQIFIGGRSIGGYQELAALARSGELEHWLKGA